MKVFKKVLIILGCIIIAAGVLIGIGLYVMGKKTNDALAKQVNVQIDMSRVQDGTYTGSSDGGMVQVQVEVAVKNHEITDIKLLKHENGKGKPAEVITEKMVAENTDDVDAISGATISSKTIRNAVNQALQAGMVE